MKYLIFIPATGLVIEFCYLFLYIYFNRQSLLGRKGRHRRPDGVVPVARKDGDKALTTEDLLKQIKPNLSDSFDEALEGH